MKDIFILGSGSIGTSLLGGLDFNSTRVILYTRETTKKYLEKNGISLTNGTTGEKKNISIDNKNIFATDNLENLEIFKNKSFDKNPLFFLSVKAFDIEQILSKCISKKLSQNFEKLNIVCLQNGLGANEKVVDFFQKSDIKNYNIFRGVV
jgi:ketopantoate reductase